MRIFRISTPQCVTNCRIQVNINGWQEVNGCLDSGAEANVAPYEYLQYATHLEGVEENTYFKLPNGAEVKPVERGKLRTRVVLTSGNF